MYIFIHTHIHIYIYIHVCLFTILIKRNPHLLKSTSSLVELIMYISADFKHEQKNNLCLQHKRNCLVGTLPYH